MTDWHTHIGRYYDSYYDFHDVFTVLKNNGIDENICAYLTPRFERKEDSVVFFHAVESELFEADAFAKSIGLRTKFLYWADPLVLEEFSLDEIFSGFKYFGIALHPLLHEWTFEHEDFVTSIFDFCGKNELPLFIHTGASFSDKPNLFEKWFMEFPNVEVHLAHCKEPDAIIALFFKYKNLFGDTAFCPSDSYKKICAAGFKNRMLFGSDFPITHWYENRGEVDCRFESLAQNYRKLQKNGVVQV